MDFKHFYIAIRRRRKGRITRGDFMIDWSDAQRKHGVQPECPEWYKTKKAALT